MQLTRVVEWLSPCHIVRAYPPNPVVRPYCVVEYMSSAPSRNVRSSHQLPCGPTRTLRLAHLALGSNRPAGSSRQPVVVNERFCGCLEQDCSSRPLIVVLRKSYRFRRARDLRGGACSHSKARHAAFFARARHPHAHMRLVVRPWLLATVWCVAGRRSQAYCGGRACDCFILSCSMCPMLPAN